MLIIFVLIGTLFFLDLKRRKRFKTKVKIIDDEILRRKSLEYNWQDFNTHFIKLGNTNYDVLMIKTILQEYSRVAQVIILPEDHLLGDLLITSYGNELKEISSAIKNDFKIQINILQFENNKLTVENLFQKLRETNNSQQ